MTLPYSGPLSFSNIAGQFGNSGPISLSSYTRGGTYVPSIIGNANQLIPANTLAGIKVSNFQGATKVYTVTIGANTKQAYIGPAVAGGSNVTPSGYSLGDSLYIKIASNLYVWSDDTAVAGLTIATASNGQTGITIDTSTNAYPAYIIGKGGTGGAGNVTSHIAPTAGGPALNIFSTAGKAGSTVSVVLNGAYGYIAGGGGGGAYWEGSDSGSIIYGGGGGGAGGGDGGSTYATRHGDNLIGGIGGAIGLIGANGASIGTTSPIGGTAGGRGGYHVTDGAGKTHDGSSAGSGGGRVLPGIGATAGTAGGGGSNNSPGSNGSLSSLSAPGGGGGGWGARGGYGGSNADSYASYVYSPGAGGPSIIYTSSYSTISFGNTQADRTYGAYLAV